MVAETVAGVGVRDALFCANNNAEVSSDKAIRNRIREIVALRMGLTGKAEMSLVIIASLTSPQALHWREIATG